MKRYKIALDTMTDINKFVKFANSVDANIKLTDGKDYAVNGKSLLGVICSMEWDNIFCLVPDDIDIYNFIQEFVIE